MNLREEIRQIISPPIAADEQTFNAFLKQVEEPYLTRDENPQSHFCIHFLPYNSKTKEVFLVDHKKAGTWISPGGHIDKGESILLTLNRELNEELGLVDFFKQNPLPFFLSIKKIDNPKQTCKTHFDIWFIVETDKKDFKVDTEEFYDSRWIKIVEAKKFLKDENNLLAIDRVSGLV